MYCLKGLKNIFNKNWVFFISNGFITKKVYSMEPENYGTGDDIKAKF